MQSISYNRQLTMPNDIQSTVRSVSTNIDDTKMLSFITEAQLQDIKPVIGDSLYIDLLKYANRSETDPVNEIYDALMDGAIYQYNDVDYMFAGLRFALNYYAYARIVKFGDGNVTRFGFVNKQDQYSSRHDIAEKQMEYKDATKTADTVMQDCIRFIEHNIESFPKYAAGKVIKTGITIQCIGD